MDAKNRPFALIIEDEPELALIFSNALTVAGFETNIVTDGLIARQQLQTLTPDVVVLDLHLPGVMGSDLLAQIRADTRLQETKVIVATADSRLATQIKEDADLVLLKPIGFRELRDIVQQL